MEGAEAVIMEQSLTHIVPVGGVIVHRFEGGRFSSCLLAGAAKRKDFG